MQATEVVDQLRRTLAKMGYSTGFFGKWHLGIHKHDKDFLHHPLNHGFDYYYGMPLSNLAILGPPETLGSSVNPKSLPFFLLPQVPRRTLDMIMYTALCSFFAAMVLPLPRRLKIVCLIVSLFAIIWVGANILFHIILIRLNGIVMRNKDVVEQPVDLSSLTKRLTEEVVNFLKKKEKEPFLAVVSYHKVHVALATHDDFRGKSSHGLYGDSVDELDWSVGKILSQLKASGLEDTTFVYFTSDHGPGGYETVNGERQGGWAGPFKGGKGNNWEGGIRVPTVARWPGLIRPGSLYHKPTSGMDLFPALAHIIGAPLPKDRIIDGINFLPKITSTEQSVEERYFFHYCGTSLTAVTYIPPSSDHVWKLHYEIPEWPLGEDHFTENCARCFGEGIKKLKEPLLYDLSVDKSEKHSLLPTDDLYKDVVKIIDVAVVRHKSSVTSVERQLTASKQRASISRIHCCNFPWCSCREKPI